MEKKENSSNGQDRIPPDPKNGIPAKSPVKTKRRKKRMFTTQFKLLIAFITAITPIAVAYLGYKTTHPDPTAIPVSTPTVIPLPTQVSTDIPVAFTDMPLSTGLPSWTNTPTVTPTTAPTETVTSLPQLQLMVVLEVSKTSGKKPLNVKLDARNSYITDYSGQKYVCRNGTCSYTWKVYSNGVQLGKSETGSGGTFDYTFGKQGTYMVTVWICRGQDKIDCNGSGAQIVVTK